MAQQPPTAEALQRNFLLMTVGFSVNHATVVTVIALATAHLGQRLGAYDLALFNASYVVTGLAAQGAVATTAPRANGLITRR